MAWIEVTEPMTGTVLTVQDDSPQAKLWADPAPSRPASTPRVKKNEN